MADGNKMTGANTHRATQRGYAIDQESKAGTLVEEGEMVPANVPVSDTWMEKVKKGDQALAAAVEDAQQEKKDDPAYESLSKQALEALATDKGVTNVKGLSKDDLITAIKAAADRDRTV